MIRLLLPSLLGLAFAISIIWILYYLVVFYANNNAEADDAERGKKTTKSVARILTLLSIFFYVFYVINIASVNEVPRTDIDRSAQQEAVKNLDARLIKDTTTIKNK
jgi:formate hydrogenlyase subunit 3/multisubunit Na+/H+ antiporter MnhD subunit